MQVQLNVKQFGQVKTKKRKKMPAKRKRKPDVRQALNKAVPYKMKKSK